MIGVSTDQTNSSSTLGGVSGVLTFNAPISASLGRSGSRVAPSDRRILPSSFNAAFFDGDGSASISTCQAWSTTCSGEGQVTLKTSSDTVISRRNAAEAINGAASAAVDGSASPSPPSQSIRPAHGLALGADIAVKVRPSFALKDVRLKNPGEDCAVLDQLRLSGGPSEEDAVAVVDAVSGSSVAAFHLKRGGRYAEAPASNLSGAAAGRCAGTAFEPQMSLQLMQTSPPS